MPESSIVARLRAKRFRWSAESANPTLGIVLSKTERDEVLDEIARLEALVHSTNPCPQCGTLTADVVRKAGVGKRSTTKSNWSSLIAYAEQKLARSRIKTAQLEALLATFRHQASEGEPCPTDILDALEDVLHAAPHETPDS